MASDLSNVLGLLESRRRLEREKGIKSLEQLYKDNSLSAEDERKLKETLRNWISSSQPSSSSSSSCNGEDSSSRRWEKRHGAIMAAIVLVQRKTTDPSFIEYIKSTVPELLMNDESRVRIETGRALIRVLSLHTHTLWVQHTTEHLTMLCKHGCGLLGGVRPGK